MTRVGMRRYQAQAMANWKAIETHHKSTGGTPSSIARLESGIWSESSGIFRKWVHPRRTMAAGSELIARRE